jgi:hypothetical protein
LELAGSQAARFARCRYLEKGKGPYHGHIVTLLDEPVFDPKLDVAETSEGRPAPGTVIRVGGDNVKLHVGRYTVIGLKVRGCA